jgi:hypothetical protein
MSVPGGKEAQGDVAGTFLRSRCASSWCASGFAMVSSALKDTRSYSYFSTGLVGAVRKLSSR